MTCIIPSGSGGTQHAQKEKQETLVMQKKTTSFLSPLYFLLVVFYSSHPPRSVWKLKWTCHIFKFYIRNPKWWCQWIKKTWLNWCEKFSHTLYRAWGGVVNKKLWNWYWGDDAIDCLLLVYSQPFVKLNDPFLRWKVDNQIETNYWLLLA